MSKSVKKTRGQERERESIDARTSNLKRLFLHILSAPLHAHISRTLHSFLHALAFSVRRTAAHCSRRVVSRVCRAAHGEWRTSVCSCRVGGGGSRTRPGDRRWRMAAQDLLRTLAIWLYALHTQNDTHTHTHTNTHTHREREREVSYHRCHCLQFLDSILTPLVEFLSAPTGSPSGATFEPQDAVDSYRQWLRGRKRDVCVRIV